MDTRFLWSDVDSPMGSVAIQSEDLIGLSVRSHDNWEDDDDLDDDDDWDDEDEEEWDDEDDEDWDDEDDDLEV